LIHYRRIRHRWNLLAPPPAGFIMARLLDLTAASRKSDGGAAEGSSASSLNFLITILSHAPLSRFVTYSKDTPNNKI